MVAEFERTGTISHVYKDEEVEDFYSNPNNNIFATADRMGEERGINESKPKHRRRTSRNR